MTHFGFELQNCLSLSGYISLIGLSPKHTFSNLFKPTNMLKSTDIILFDCNHNSRRFNRPINTLSNLVIKFSSKFNISKLLKPLNVFISISVMFLSVRSISTELILKPCVSTVERLIYDLETLVYASETHNFIHA